MNRNLCKFNGVNFKNINLLKAIGIVFVVIGHAPGLNEHVRKIIFSVHMPLFFYASGYLLKDERLSLGFISQLSSVVRGLIVPYVLFFLISYSYWLLTRQHGNAVARYAGLAAWDPLFGLLRGNGDVLYVNATLWFFPCLVVVVLAYAQLRRILTAHHALALSGLAVLLYLQFRSADWLRLYWSADCAIVGLFFYSVGQVLRQHALSTSALVKFRNGWMVMALWGVYSALALSNGVVDINNLMFGDSPLLFLLTALLGIAALSLLADLLPSVSLANTLASSTIYIFPMHWLLYRVFNGVGAVVFHLPRDFAESSWLFGLGYVVLALLLSLVFAWAVRKCSSFRRPFVQLVGRSGAGES